MMLGLIIVVILVGLFCIQCGSETAHHRQPTVAAPDGSKTAVQTLRRLNPNGFIAEEDGLVCMIEDHTDPDGRMFRLEYISTPDGRHAVAYCRHSPWSNSTPHQLSGGLICIGPGGHNPVVRQSAYTLDHVVPRARFWCTAASVYHETGEFPQ